MKTERADNRAKPRSAAELESVSRCPEVIAAAERRGISQVVHFTTVKGAVGILATKAVKSRARLSEDLYLEHVYSPNALNRTKDEAWLDYVNLSVERINDWMFEKSKRWHVFSNNPWVVLSFHPRMLGHPGVVFTTTNNIYPACERAEGLIGFCRMFGDTVYGRYGSLHDRVDKSAEWPTDRQAEVLYPGELSCDYLQRIDVQLEQSLDTIAAAADVLNVMVPIRHASEVFI